jgi:hypothetical protein
MTEWNKYYCGLCEVEFAVKTEADKGESSCPKCESGEDTYRMEATKSSHLTTIEITLPAKVVESLDYMVSELTKEEPGISRNGIVSYLLQNYYVEEGFYDRNPNETRK